ncbi:protein mei2-like 2 [Anaeramoeba flamelloides]|uniref:Protein mei2-like 2 n=1 Tax=Anaeramoeba flamelloides TaxID=1746091 RepID=A0ABQ8ZEA4_9EUKA|nr:protein mei2-like 2 [Anaeramoeba flamelloides]
MYQRPNGIFSHSNHKPRLSDQNHNPKKALRKFATTKVLRSLPISSTFMKDSIFQTKSNSIPVSYYQDSEIELIKTIWKQKPNTNQKGKKFQETTMYAKNKLIIETEYMENEKYQYNNYHNFKMDNTLTLNSKSLLIQEKKKALTNYFQQQKEIQTQNKNTDQDQISTQTEMLVPTISVYPTRKIYIRLIPNNLSKQKMILFFKKFGSIRRSYLKHKLNSYSLIIEYYDLRHSESAHNEIHDKKIEDQEFLVNYVNTIPLSDRNQNQGTLVVFGLTKYITNNELVDIFSKYGPLRDIRSTPNKVYHRFIEFYDIRDAEKAMKCLNKTKINTRRIKIEPARTISPKKQALIEKKKPKKFYVSFYL